MKRTITLITFMLGVCYLLSAQNLSGTNPTSLSTSNGPAWEIGIHDGHIFAAGNIDFIPGYGGGIHIRKSLDYVFSLRLDLNYGQPKGEDPGNVRSFEGTWMSGSLQAIASLNNLNWKLGERKTNLYALGGFGLNNFESELTENDVKGDKIEADVASHFDLGAGISFRINKNVNISIEHKAMMVVGKRSDLIDGVATFTPQEYRSVSSAEEAFEIIPNFTFDGQDPARPTISLRGLATLPGNAGIENSVGLYIDDVFLSRSYGFNSTLMDIERVEVLRGPQGTLFG